VKCRLRQMSLSQPGVAFIREQTLAEEPSAVAYDAILQKVLSVSNQHGFNQVGMVQEIDVKPNGAVIKDIAKLFRPAGKQGERSARGKGHIADEKVRFGSRGAAWHGASAT
jgi:hypothetical protein